MKKSEGGISLLWEGIVEVLYGVGCGFVLGLITGIAFMLVAAAVRS